MEYVEVTTQADLDKALERGNVIPVIKGDGTFVFTSGAPRVEARESSAPRVEAWGSSAPLVEAWGSSAPLVVARESSAPRVEARESSAPRVEAWGSSAPRVEARGSSAPRVEAWGSSAPTGTVGRFAAVVASRHGRAKLDLPGAVLLEQPTIETAEQWCDYHGARVEDGVVTLYKAVDAEYRSDYVRPGGERLSYAPGTKPEAPDWDGGKAECGGGIHCTAQPAAALAWYGGVDPRFVALPVRLEDVVVHRDAMYPTKVKVPRVCAPVYEVDIDGEPVERGRAAA